MPYGEHLLYLYWWVQSAPYLRWMIIKRRQSLKSLTPNKLLFLLELLSNISMPKTIIISTRMFHKKLVLTTATHDMKWENSSKDWLMQLMNCIKKGRIMKLCCQRRKWQRRRWTWWRTRCWICMTSLTIWYTSCWRISLWRSRRRNSRLRRERLRRFHQKTWSRTLKITRRQQISIPI